MAFFKKIVAMLSSKKSIEQDDTILRIYFPTTGVGSMRGLTYIFILVLAVVLLYPDPNATLAKWIAAIFVISLYLFYSWYWYSGERRIVIDKNEGTITFSQTTLFGEHTRVVQIHEITKVEVSSRERSDDAVSYWDHRLSFARAHGAAIRLSLSYDNYYSVSMHDIGKRTADFIGVHYNEKIRMGFAWLLIDAMYIFGLILVFILVMILFGY